MVDHRKSGKLAAAFTGAACLAFAGLAHAQTSNAGAIALVRANNQQVMSTYASAHDASGASVSTDGAIEAGEDQSGLSNAGVTGAGDTLSGVGSTGGATIFGDALSVVSQAGQPAIVPNNQINSGGGVADASPSGGVSNVDQSIQQR
jgi:hypothetical protein